MQATPLEMGPLAFAARSHHFEVEQDIEISDESEARIREMLQAQNFTHVEEPYKLGEVSVHSGWTFHRAGGNSTPQARAVMTIIYMEDGIRLIKPRNKHHQQDWEAWLPGLKSGRSPTLSSTQCCGRNDSRRLEAIRRLLQRRLCQLPVDSLAA